jgi:hypothetical protein
LPQAATTLSFREVNLCEIRDELVGAAVAVAELAPGDDLLQAAHLVGAEGHRPLGAHLHAGPAVVVVRGGDHGDTGAIEGELAEIGHRREGEADILHPQARRLHPGDQRELDRGGVGAEIVAGDDVGAHAALMDQRAEPQPERLDAHQVDLLREQPAGVVLAKARGLDHRPLLEGEGVRLEPRQRRGKGLGPIGRHGKPFAQAGANEIPCAAGSEAENGLRV